MIRRKDVPSLLFVVAALCFALALDALGLDWFYPGFILGGFVSAVVLSARMRARPQPPDQEKVTSPE